MGFQDELERAKQELTQALLATQEKECQAHSHQAILIESIRSQRQAMIELWSPIIISLLTETARVTWGEDSYTIIQTDSHQSLTWYAVHVCDGNKLNFQVSIDIWQANPEDTSVNSSDVLVRPTRFVVRGNEEHICDTSETALKEALLSVFKSGPLAGGLDRSAETALNKNPYQKGESDRVNWLIILSVLINLFIALLPIAAGFNELISRNTEVPEFTFCFLVLLGLLFMPFPLISFYLTSYGTKFKRLPLGKKIIVLAGIAPGALLGLCSGVFIIMGILSLFLLMASEAGKESRIQEVEEGVKRAIR